MIVADHITELWINSAVVLGGMTPVRAASKLIPKSPKRKSPIGVLANQMGRALHKKHKMNFPMKQYTSALMLSLIHI